MLSVQLETDILPVRKKKTQTKKKKNLETLLLLSGRIAQVVERRPLNCEVRGSNPSHDIMALLLGRHYKFPQCGINKKKSSITNPCIKNHSIQTGVSVITLI
jgi:hypothetical protein